jgi:putative membrane protein
MLGDWWRLVRAGAIGVGALLSFLAVIEILRAFLVLRDVSPWLGFGFLAVVIGGAGALLARFLTLYLRLPRAPAPPEVADAAAPSADEALELRDFLEHRITQLGANPQLPGASSAQLAALRARLAADASPAGIESVQFELEALLAPLDERAERIVQECVRDVMIAVVLSPYRSADLLIVLYRNGRMVLELAQLYQTRPSPLEQMRIARDVVAIVATVNLLNFTEKFLEQLVERVPVLGQVGGDVTQGVGAGLLTSATGHAAIARCKCISAFSRASAQAQLAQRMSRFARDVKSILTSEVLPRVRPRFAVLAGVSDTLAAAFDATVDGMSDWIWRPIRRGTRSLGRRTRSLLRSG